MSKEDRNVIRLMYSTIYTAIRFIITLMFLEHTMPDFFKNQLRAIERVEEEMDVLISEWAKTGLIETPVGDSK